jgi:hypothetical protein
MRSNRHLKLCISCNDSVVTVTNGWVETKAAPFFSFWVRAEGLDFLHKTIIPGWLIQKRGALNLAV